jgi:NNP family nitrate/nitrite transporter-like MFS transporter
MSSPPDVSSRKKRRVLTVWTPEDQAFWAQEGQAIANVNLWISIPALFLAFAVWQMWSVVAVNLPNLGFQYTENQLFWLAALPALSGATLRIFYSFMVPVFGGRLWTTLTTASLLLPTIGVGIAVQDPTTPYSTMLMLALLCGLGGGNFSSSMSNISFFFPKERKGSALGLNAGLGNLGVSSVQFLAPLVITMGVLGPWAGGPQMATLSGAHGAPTEVWAQNAAFIWVPFIIIVTMLAWVGMHDIADAKASFSQQAVIFKRRHNWIMCFLYLGTFGSFIGFSAGYPLLVKSLFPDERTLQYAWMGPFLGAAIRPVGGWLADRLGGAKITMLVFLLMILGVVAVLFTLPNAAHPGNFPAFLLAFLWLFAMAGIGSGSSFCMIPAVFLNWHLRHAPGGDAQAVGRAESESGTEAAAALGFAGAIGAYGGFFIPKSFGSSLSSTGGAGAALLFFIVFYVVCIAVTWWFHTRRGASMPC